MISWLTILRNSCLITMDYELQSIRIHHNPITIIGLIHHYNKSWSSLIIILPICYSIIQSNQFESPHLYSTIIPNSSHQGPFAALRTLRLGGGEHHRHFGGTLGAKNVVLLTINDGNSTRTHMGIWMNMGIYNQIKSEWETLRCRSQLNGFNQPICGDTDFTNQFKWDFITMQFFGDVSVEWDI